MKAKKKICPTCGEEKYLWSRKVGCKECVAKSKVATKSDLKNKGQTVAVKGGLKRKPLAPISDKRKKQQIAYKALLIGWLAANKHCARCGKPTEARHHKKHREGERLNDTKYWMPVCNACHAYIHAHPEESYRKGWLIKG